MTRKPSPRYPRPIDSNSLEDLVQSVKSLPDDMAVRKIRRYILTTVIGNNITGEYLRNTYRSDLRQKVAKL